MNDELKMQNADDEALNRALDVWNILADGIVEEPISFTLLKKTAVSQLLQKYDFDVHTAEALYDMINYDPNMDIILLKTLANPDLYKSEDEVVSLYFNENINLIPSHYFFEPSFIKETECKTLPTKLFGSIVHSDVTEIVVPEGIETISASAFFGCKSLQKVTLPSTVKRIEANAFRGCEALADINIPDSVEYIGKGAFRGCVALQSISIPQKITALPGEVFQNCYSLAEINTANELSVGFRTFYGCRSLRRLPATIVECDEESFAGCSKLRNIDLRAAMIQKRCFAECIKLEDLNLLRTPCFIGSKAFDRCISLRKVNHRSSLCEVNTCEGISWLLSEVRCEQLPELFHHDL